MSQILLGNSSAGEQVYIDLATLISTRLLVTASSGGGKSETLRRILEEACEHVQCIVIDPEGEFSTLREKKPFLLVGEGGETSADIRTASLVATRLLEFNVSAVCDLYEMRVQDRHEWVKRFLDSMVHAPKALWHPVLVVIDEAHTFAPEKGYGESVAAQSVIDIANLGRKRGFCVIPATQRLSKLSKNVVEPMQNYLVGRTTFDDQERAAKVFKIKPGAEMRNFCLELERLKDGEFIARGRAITGDMLKVQVTRGTTRPPATGTAMAGIVTPTPEAVKALLPKLADLPREAENRVKTEEDLRRELSETKRLLAAVNADAPRQLFELRDAHFALTRDAEWLRKRCEHLEDFSRRLMRLVDDFNISTPVSLPELKPAPWVAGPLAIASPPCQSLAPKSLEPVEPIKLQKHYPAAVSSMPKACRAVMTALALHGACTKSKISALTGYAVNGGGFNNALGACRTNQWINAGDPITATPEGLEALGPIQQLPTGKELMEMWNVKLGKAEREIVAALLGSELTKQALANRTGYAESGGGFNNALGRLRTLELIEGKGSLRLAPDFAQAVRA